MKKTDELFVITYWVLNDLYKELTNGRQWWVGGRECRMEVADACLDVGNPFFTILRKFHSLKIHEIS